MLQLPKISGSSIVIDVEFTKLLLKDKSFALFPPTFNPIIFTDSFNRPSANT